MSGEYVKTINNGVPNFKGSELSTTCVEKYSELDMLGRCGPAFAILGKDTMPKDGASRGDISSVTPSGWNQKSYSSIKTDNNTTGSLYNRCHLIGWQLSAENANAKNLITGTAWLNSGDYSDDPNTGGMLYYENKVAKYLKNNPSKHVAYRVTPHFQGDDLVATSVQMEAYSIEDQGASICFNVELANVQPGIEINYSDGSSKKGTDNKKEIEYNYYDYKDPRNMVFVPYLMDDKGASIPLELDSISVNMSNYFTETHLKACDGYAPQYMGGSDVGIEIRATITDEYYVGVLKNLPHVIMNMIRNYRRVMPCFPLKIKNDYLQMLGVNEVVLENISVSTKPGFPGVFDVVIKLSSMDRSMRQREALQKVDHNGITSANAALNIYSYFNLQESLAQAELYPDLDLPTIQELTDLGWKFAKWSNEDRVYVDPDFYVCYSFAYSSKLIKEVINNILYRVIYPSDSKDSLYNIADSDSATHTLTAMQLVDNYNIAMKVRPGKENNGLETGEQNGYAIMYDQILKQISAKAHDDNTIKKKVSNKPTEEQVKTTISTLEYLTALGIENGWQVKPGWYAPICSEYINKEMEKYPYAGIVQMPKKVNEEDYDQFIRDIYDMRHRAIMLINRLLDKQLSTSQTAEVDPCVSAWDAVQAVFGTDDGKKLLDLLCPMVDPDQKKFEENKQQNANKNDRLRMTTEFFEEADPIRWLQGLLYALACCRSGQEEYGDGKSENAWKARQWNDQADLAEQQQADGLNYFAIPYNKVQQGRGIAGDGILATSEESALTDGISYGAGQLTIYNVETIKTMMQPESKIKYFNKEYLSGASENYNHMYHKTREAGRDKFSETGFIDLYYNFAGYKSVEGKDYIEKISKSQTCNYEALLREVLMHLKRLIMDGYIFSEVDVVAQDWDTVLAEVLGEGENLETILADSENIQKGNMYTMGLYEQSMINKAAASEGGLEQEMEEQTENKQYKEIATALKEEIPKSYARLFCARLTYAFAMASCNGDINLVNLLKARNYDELDTYTLSSLVGGSNNDKFNKFLGCMYGIGMIGSSNLTDSAEITSNTQKAFNTLMSEAYTEMANDPKCYVLHSYYDMCVSDKRGRLLRAFPTYYMFFIDEGRAIGSWRLFDNFYNMSSISNIQVVKSRKMPADTCTFTMSNMFTSYADHYDNTIYNQYVNEYGFKDTYYSVFAPREYVNREDARRKRKELTDTTAITPGVRIHVRMGYGSDGSKLPIVFNGKIAEIGCGEVVEIVAQGDGHELCNPLNALGDLTAINLDESQSWTTMFKDIRGSLARGGQTPRNLLAKLATAQHGGVIKSVIREVSNGRWYYDNPFGIYHFGDKRYKDIFEDSEIVQNMYEVSNKTMLNGTNDLLEDMSTVNAAPLLNCNIQDKTMWEIGHLCANSGDDFYFAVRDFGLRSTMCLCRANHYYAFEYRRDETTGVVGERRKPFQQFHYYDSYNDIIYNTFKASESNMKTNAVGTWEGTDYLWGTSQQSVGPIYLDMNIYPEYQKSMTVETGLVAGGDGGIDIPIFNALAEKYNYNEYAGRVNKSLAEKVTTNVLRQSVKDMYEGEICIIADPSLKPYDRVTLVDVYEDMSGDVEVETVIHSMNIETGFTTTFIPDLIVRVENTAQECGCQSVMANITLGIVSSVTLKGAVAAAATKGIDGLAKMGTKTLVQKTTEFAGKKAASTVIGNLLKGVGSAAGKVGIFANPVALASVAITATCVFMLAQSAKEMFTRFCRNIQALTVFPVTKNGRLLIAGMSGHKGSVYGFPYTQEQAKDSIQGFIMDFTSLNYDSFALDCIGGVFDFFLTDDNYQAVKNRWMNNLGLTDNEDIMQDDASDTRNKEAFIQFLSHAISTEYASRAVMLASLKTKPRISSFNTDNRTNDIYLKYQIGGIHDKTSKQIGKLEVDETMTKAVSASELKTNERIKRLLPVEDDPDIKIARISNTHPVVKQFLFAHSKSPLTFDLKMEDENTAIRYIAEGGGKTKVFDLPMLQEDAMMVLKLILNMDNLKGKTVTFLSGTRVNDTNSWKSTGFWFALHCDDMKALEAASKEVREDSSWHEGKKSFAYRVDSDCIQYTVYAPNDITNSQFFRSDHIGDD